MSNLRQAAQQALEALEAVNNESLWWGKKDAAITALRAALSEPEQPVAWWIPKYKAPDMVSKVRWSDDCEPLYTTPRQRRPLTDEEIKAVIQSIDPDEQYLPKALRQFARAIERYHGITGEQT